MNFQNECLQEFLKLFFVEYQKESIEMYPKGNAEIFGECRNQFMRRKNARAFLEESPVKFIEESLEEFVKSSVDPWRTF